MNKFAILTGQKFMFSLDDMDFTMMRQMCRRGRVDAFFEDNPDMEPLKRVLEPQNTEATLDCNPPLMSPDEHQHFNKTSIHFPRDEYQNLLLYLHQTGRPFHSAFNVHNDLPRGVQCLSPFVRKLHNKTFEDRTFSTKTSHRGNSLIHYLSRYSGRLEVAFIDSIWTLPIEDRLHTFFVVNPLLPLPPVMERLAPFHAFDPAYGVRIFDATPTRLFHVVEPRNIISHVSLLDREAGTYGIPRKTLVVSWAMNRGRR